MVLQGGCWRLRGQRTDPAYALWGCGTHGEQRLQKPLRLESPSLHVRLRVCWKQRHTGLRRTLLMLITAETRRELLRTWFGSGGKTEYSLVWFLKQWCVFTVIHVKNICALLCGGSKPWEKPLMKGSCVHHDPARGNRRSEVTNSFKTHRQEGLSQGGATQ